MNMYSYLHKPNDDHAKCELLAEVDFIIIGNYRFLLCTVVGGTYNVLILSIVGFL